MTIVESGAGARPLRLDQSEMKRHNDRIIEAEALVGTIDRLWSEGFVLHAGSMKEAFANTWHAGQGLPIELGDAQRLFASLSETKEEWDDLDSGAALERSWLFAPARPNVRKLDVRAPALLRSRG